MECKKEGSVSRRGGRGGGEEGYRRVYRREGRRRREVDRRLCPVGEGVVNRGKEVKRRMGEGGWTKRTRE